MSKIVILGDTHIGARNDSLAFHDYFRKFYQECLFPYMEQNGITDIIQCGDIFDRRKYVNFHTLSLGKEYFFDDLGKRGFQLYMPVGNHDCSFKNTNSVNSPRLLLSEYDNIHIWDTAPGEVTIQGTKFLMVPWINEENEKITMAAMEQSGAMVCVGHFEINGFSMYEGYEAQEGLSLSLFNSFKLTLSGHYHHRSYKEHVAYVGTPYEMTWQDYGDKKGFHVLDTDTMELEFIENPFTMFEKIVYNDGATLPNIDEKYVKVIVEQKNDQYMYDQFINRVLSSNAHDIKIVEGFSDVDLEEGQKVHLEDTMGIVRRYITSFARNNSSMGVDEDALQDLMKGLYLEAMTYTGEQND